MINKTSFNKITSNIIDHIAEFKKRVGFEEVRQIKINFNYGNVETTVKYLKNNEIHKFQITSYGCDDLYTFEKPKETKEDKPKETREDKKVVNKMKRFKK